MNIEYSIYGENDYGCSTYYTTNIFEPNEIISGVPAIQEVCAGTDLEIGITGISGGTLPYIYDWSSNGVSVSTLDTFDITISSDTTLILIISDSNSCTSIYANSVTVPDELIVTASDDIYICPGESVDLTLINTSGGQLIDFNGTFDYIYNWSPEQVLGGSLDPMGGSLDPLGSFLDLLWLCLDPVGGGPNSL